MYFSQTGNDVTDLVTGRVWTLPTPGTANYVKDKPRMINSAKDYQARALERIRRVLGQHFYTVEQLADAYSHLA
jgi:hypothetical protein